VLLGAAAPAAGAAWPDLASGPLRDNSFLVEEAYNQEAGVVQHILDAAYDSDTHGWLLSFTQEWPAPDETNQLSFTVPFGFAGRPDDPSGVGNVFLNYRHEVLAETARWPAVTPRLSVLLPTGSRRLGGAAGVQLGLPVSKQLGEHFAAHLNIGATIVPRADTDRGSTRLLLGSGGASLVWEPVDAINLLCELVTLGGDDVDDGRATRRVLAFVNPGIRVGGDGPGGSQLVWGIGFPVGLTEESPSLAVFLYFSLEHPFTRAARASVEGDGHAPASAAAHR
jgi:hypothetical protein